MLLREINSRVEGAPKAVVDAQLNILRILETRSASPRRDRTSEGQAVGQAQGRHDCLDGSFPRNQESRSSGPHERENCCAIPG